VENFLQGPERQQSAWGLCSYDRCGSTGEEGIAEGEEGKGIRFDEGGGAADIAGMVGVGEGDEGVSGAIGGLHVGEVVAGDFKDGAAFGREAAELGEDAAGAAIDVGGDEEAAVGGDEAGEEAEGNIGGVAEIAFDEF